MPISGSFTVTLSENPNHAYPKKLCWNRVFGCAPEILAGFGPGGGAAHNDTLVQHIPLNWPIDRESQVRPTGNASLFWPPSRSNGDMVWTRLGQELLAMTDSDSDGASVRMRRRAGPHVRHFYRRMRALSAFRGRHCSLPRMAGPVGQPAPKRSRLGLCNWCFLTTSGENLIQ